MDPLTRDQVYDRLNSERDYQDAQAAPHMVEHLSIGETILAAEKALADARVAWYNNTAAESYAYPMQHLRKVAALVVQAAEHYGMPRREGF